MKSKMLTSKLLSLLILISISLTFNSCSDDDDDSDSTTLIPYRTKEFIYKDVYDGDLYEEKNVLTYNNELLTEVIWSNKENGNWIENNKTAVTYQGDWVYFNYYYKDGNLWVENSDDYSSRIKIVNGKVVEEEYSSDNHIYRYIYTYNGDKLIKAENFENGTLDWKEVYTYNGGELQEIIEYYYHNGIEEIEDKQEFSYTDGKLTEIISYYYSNGALNIEDKDVYHYSGNLVVKIDDYNFSNGNWELDDITNFSYNSLGLVETITNNELNFNYYWEENFIYEEGRGNLKLIYDEGGWYDTHNYPSPQKTSTNKEQKPNYKDLSRRNKIIRYFQN